ncbi:MAG: helix-turn-helix domain-containing protein [Alkalibacterium sp.]|nr:helix-turn-helix domain-containing protein [Alkalibacterium sp.]
MNHIGKTFRTLRKERGYTLKTMSKGIVSFSYLSKFEQGKSDITVTTLIALLKRLHISINEFLFFNDIIITEYNDLFKKVSVEYAKNNSSKLLEYSQEEMKLYEETRNPYHKCNAIMISAIVHDIDECHRVSSEDKDFLMDYLVKCTYWSKYEVSLFGNAHAVFSETSLLILLKEIEKRVVEYKIKKQNIRELIAVLENACFSLLKKDHLEEAKMISLFLDSYMESKYYYEKTRKLFIDGLILILEGHVKEGTGKAKKAIEIMRYMDEQFAEDHLAELDKYLK